MERQVLVALVEEGLTVRGIAERLETTHATVRYWMGKHEIVTPRGRMWRDSRAAGEELAASRRGLCPKHGEVRFVRRDTGFRCERCRSEAVSERRRAVKRLLVAEAGGACRACGYDRCLAALHFRHLNPATKSFAVAGMGLSRSIEASRAEATKCILLCANCHAEVEAAERALPYTSPPADPG